MTSYLELGASLYMPATRPDLAEVANRRRLSGLRSVIFCTEDSIAERDVAQAMENLSAVLRGLEPTELLRFIRPRNPVVLRRILAMEGVERIDGFVLPKVTAANLDDYFDAIPEPSRFLVMPTLETAEVLDRSSMERLRDLMSQERRRSRIVALRIGGNDLLNLLGVRRPRDRTIYDTPLGFVIARLVAAFRPRGFRLTAPVFEYLDRPDILAEEVERDLLHGLCAKSAVHPSQVSIIESRYAVGSDDLEAATRIMRTPESGVFRLHDAMCEPATHRAWAMEILERGRIYGRIREREDEGHRRTVAEADAAG